MLHTTTSRQIARLARSKPCPSWNGASPSATSLSFSLPLCRHASFGLREPPPSTSKPRYRDDAPSYRGRDDAPSYRGRDDTSSYRGRDDTSSYTRAPRTSRAMFPSDPKQMKCFNCGKHGHIAKECTEETMCLNCGESGHKAGQCTNNTKCWVCGQEVSPWFHVLSYISYVVLTCAFVVCRVTKVGIVRCAVPVKRQ